MAKNPAFLFYSADFLIGCTFLTMEERGQYITLLCNQHQLGHLPENHMISVCSSLDSPVVAKFERDENGLFFNKRLQDETDKRKKHTEHQRENVSKRWNGNTERIPKRIPKPYDGITVVIPLENDNEKENEEENTLQEGGAGGRDYFYEFWAAYPKKKGKGAAEQSWKKIKRPAETVALILDALKWQCVSDQWTRNNGQYIPHPSTYLNQRRWEDEPEQPGTGADHRTAKQNREFPENLDF